MYNGINPLGRIWYKLILIWLFEIYIRALVSLNNYNFIYMTHIQISKVVKYSDHSCSTRKCRPNLTKLGCKLLHNWAPSYKMKLCNFIQYKSRTLWLAILYCSIRRIIHIEYHNFKTLLHLIEYINNLKIAKYYPNQICSDKLIEKC